jgi:hypothetical protein
MTDWSAFSGKAEPRKYCINAYGVLYLAFPFVEVYF